MEVGGGVAVVDRLASPRVIKSHLPLHLLPPKLLDTCKVRTALFGRSKNGFLTSLLRTVIDESNEKMMSGFRSYAFLVDLVELWQSLFFSQVVYVARNPKDVIVSFYHHHKLIKFHEFKGDVARFADYFMKGLSGSCCSIFLGGKSKLLLFFSLFRAVFHDPLGGLEPAPPSQSALPLLRRPETGSLLSTCRSS